MRGICTPLTWLCRTPAAPLQLLGCKREREGFWACVPHRVKTERASLAQRQNAACHAPRTHRVPDLQLNLLAVDVDHAGPKLYTNGEVVHGLEALVCELQQQT
eukprot:1157380-Pelagomonas_calceolata.AAC.12